MGFLLGAFGKQMAGTRYRSLQARMMKISAKVRRIHREQERMQKAIDREYKAAKNALTFENQKAMQIAQNVMYSTINGVVDGMQLGADGQMTTEQSAKYNMEYQKAQMVYSQAQANAQMMLTQGQQTLEDNIERMKNAYIEPLKDEEEELTSEKEMLEGQIAIAKEDYEACKKMEQADIKMLTPNYTGTQG